MIWASFPKAYTEILFHVSLANPSDTAQVDCTDTTQRGCLTREIPIQNVGIVKSADFLGFC